MTITLPDEMRAELEQRAKLGGFPSVEVYVAHVLLWSEPNAIEDDEDVELPPPPADADYVVNSREELERKLLEGLNSGPAIPVTPEFWADLRKRVSERVAAKRGGS